MYVFQQAKHDGLCGFYAVLNALRHLEEQSPDSFSLAADNQEFFDEMIEMLARCGGASLRMVAGNTENGGLDVNYIAALCQRFIRQNNLPLNIRFMRESDKLTFTSQYRKLRWQNIPFALIAAHRNGEHWVAVGNNGPEHYDFIDEGKMKRKALTDRSFPLKGTEGLMLSLKVTDLTAQDN